LPFSTDDGIVVVERSEGADMKLDRVPLSVRDRLGPEGAAGLVDLLNENSAVVAAEVMDLNREHFERRLVEESSKLRVEMAHGFAGLRQEMAAGLSAVRVEMARQRVELLKWAFLFWAGQLFSVAGLMLLLARVFAAGR
jgi:hypothetical protein